MCYVLAPRIRGRRLRYQNENKKSTREWREHGFVVEPLQNDLCSHILHIELISLRRAESASIVLL